MWFRYRNRILGKRSTADFAPPPPFLGNFKLLRPLNVGLFGIFVRGYTGRKKWLRNNRPTSDHVFVIASPSLSLVLVALVARSASVRESIIAKSTLGQRYFYISQKNCGSGGVLKSNS